VNLAQALLHALKEHGRARSRHPRRFCAAFFRVIEESGVLPLYTLSHEPAVGFAADAAARVHSALVSPR